MPDEPEVIGLHALMLLTESRRPARSNTGGDLVLLADQGRIAYVLDGQQLATMG